MNSFLVQQYLENAAKRLPEKTALICGNERLSYKEINDLADLLAKALAGMGVRRQDRVAIFLDNSIESVVSLYGTLKCGGIFVMLSATMKSKKLSYILKDSGALVLVTHSTKARIVREAVSESQDLKHVIWCSAGNSPTPCGPEAEGFCETGTCGGSQKNDSSFIENHAWSDILYNPSHLEYAPCPSPTDIDLAAIIYTSGSTGDPKGVMSAHYNMISAAKSIVGYLENNENDIVLCALPLSFDYGLYQVLMTFMFGGTAVLEKSFVFPYKTIERLVREKATGFPLVPTMAALLLNMQDLQSFDFGSLRYITNTAAALPVSHIRRLQKLFPKVKIYSMYGLTECKRVCYLPPEHLDERPDSVGFAMPNEEVLIVDENGNEVNSRETGELVVVGSNVMQGYWNAPEETAKRFRRGRRRGEVRLYSGDLFRRDEHGFLYFVSRKDDMIKTKGERVSPKEIENCLCEIESVMEAAVIGVPDEILGQALKAFVVMNHAEASAAIILKHCKENLEPFMVPKYIEFLGAFEKTSSGKIDKKMLV